MNQLNFSRESNLMLYCSLASMNDEIKNLFIGYDNLHFNHVGIYIGDGEIVEAAFKGVRKTELFSFLEKAADRVLVGRIDNEIIAEQSAAISLDYIGYPYNFTYIDREDAFYCSQLIHHVYEIANDGPLFRKHKLNYKDVNTGRVSKYWIEYYRLLGLDVPEGETGSHPSNLSMDEDIDTRFYLEKEKYMN